MSALEVGLIGAGTVGGEVARRLHSRAEELERRVGCPIHLRRVAIRDAARVRPGIPAELLTTDVDAVLSDPEVSIVVELAGGEEPARTYLERALAAGKHVVTANKVVMARHGAELLELARRMDVEIAFEAAVGGGIPVIGTLTNELAANRLDLLVAIINGTTNSMLTQMASEGVDLGTALRAAQASGYAEADPTEDIEAFDSASKLAIMASIAFGAQVHPDQVYREGIGEVQAVDFRYARELGYTIKLIAYAERRPEGIEVRTHPSMVPLSHPLAHVDGATNAVFVRGDLVGELLLRAQGAGSGPTASAVLGDLIEVGRGIRSGGHASRRYEWRRAPILPMTSVTTRAYVRCTVSDHPGVLAGIFAVFGEEGVSISSAIQKEVFVGDGAAEFVVTTHPAPDAALRRTCERIAGLDSVHRVSSFLRVLSVG